jgi:hypothetical protein
LLAYTYARYHERWCSFNIHLDDVFECIIHRFLIASGTSLAFQGQAYQAIFVTHDYKSVEAESSTPFDDLGPLPMLTTTSLNSSRLISIFTPYRPIPFSRRESAKLATTP